jgi:general stress protein YciG
MTEDKKSKRGFASMSPEMRRAIASKGGKSAHLMGRAHQFDSAEAAEAGRKGGAAVSKDLGHMAKIGAMGGKARGRSIAAKKAGEPS